MSRQPDGDVCDGVVDSGVEVDNQKLGIGGRIRAVREHLQMTRKRMAEEVALPISSLRDYEMGHRAPGGDAIAAWVSIGVNANWLLTGVGPMMLADMQGARPDVALLGPAPDARDYASVPLYVDVRAAAGHGAVVDSEVVKVPLMFRSAWIREEIGTTPGNLSLINVVGDSMAPTILPGDTVMINHAARRLDRDGIYVVRMGDGLLVKRLQLMPGGQVMVRSDNPIFPPYTVPAAALAEGDCAVLGRVCWIGRTI